MPAEEFDAYLKTLSGRLRLKPARRAELSDELRDHLETRLEELTAEGVPRAAAVRKALEEFGDAAGLASQMSFAFAVHARRRRRKTVMRVTASAAATLACGIAVAYLFAPPNPAVNPPGPALAQDEPAPAAEPGDPFSASAEASGDPFGGPAAPASPDEAKMIALEKALDAPTELDARPGDTLAEALDGLASQHEIVILPDSRALAPQGMDLRDLPIDNPPKLSGYSLRTVLNVLLSAAKNEEPLAAVPRNGILFVTTQEAAGLDLETRIYNVRDLLINVRASKPADVMEGFGGGQEGGAGMFSLPPVHNQLGGMGGGGMGGGGMGGGGMGLGGMGGYVDGPFAPNAPSGPADELVDMILSVTGGDAFGGPWLIADGTGGTIEHFNGLLAVRQTAAVHRQIEDLLAALRRSAAERDWNAAATMPEPDAGATGAGMSMETLLVVVGENGILSVDGRDGLSEAEVRTALREAAARTPLRPVIVEADESVPNRAVQEAVRTVNRAGLKNVALRAADTTATDMTGDDPTGDAPAGVGTPFSNQ
ncbi:permease prefix domain 1-containing protein [Alienimonas sp. DA493]|uniref:permease prefix domain 1-containing protein n=1 Tax=Alienimonas sp. DA493 TaxID=3373605 RepID=UPI003755273F